MSPVDSVHAEHAEPTGSGRARDHPPTCGYGWPESACRTPPIAAVAVQTYPPDWERDAEPTPGVIFLCADHWPTT